MLKRAGIDVLFCKPYVKVSEDGTDIFMWKLKRRPFVYYKRPYV